MAKTMTKSAARLILGIVIAVLVFALGMTITFVVADKVNGNTGTPSDSPVSEILVSQPFADYPDGTVKTGDKRSVVYDGTEKQLVLNVPALSAGKISAVGNGADVTVSANKRTITQTAVNVGKYSITVSIDVQDGKWAVDKTVTDVVYEWEISKADNAWIETPHDITLDFGATSYESGQAKFGDVEYVYTYPHGGSQVEMNAATPAGSYHCVATVAATDNYAELKGEYDVTVLRALRDVATEADIFEVIEDTDNCRGMRLANDITLTKPLAVSRDFEIDLNGKTLTGGVQILKADKIAGDIKIKNGKIVAGKTGITVPTGELVSLTDNYYYAFVLENIYAQTTFENVELTSAYGGIAVVGATATLMDCQVEQTESRGAAIGVYLNGAANTVGGTYDASNIALYINVAGGEINVYGGVFEAATVLRTKPDLQVRPTARFTVGLFRDDREMTYHADINATFGVNPVFKQKDGVAADVQFANVGPMTDFNVGSAAGLDFVSFVTNNALWTSNDMAHYGYPAYGHWNGNITLTSDIYMSALDKEDAPYYFTPICWDRTLSSDHPYYDTAEDAKQNGEGYFAGIFDGRRYTIYDLKFKIDDTLNYSIGLVGYVAYSSQTDKGGILRDITLARASVCGNANTYKKGYAEDIGFFVGKASLGSRFERLTVRNSQMDFAGGKYVGGIVGYANGSDFYSCSVMNVKFDISALKTATNYVEGRQVGGIVGFLASEKPSNYLLNSVVNNVEIRGVYQLGGLCGTIQWVTTSTVYNIYGNTVSKVNIIADRRMEDADIPHKNASDRDDVHFLMGRVVVNAGATREEVTSKLNHTSEDPDTITQLVLGRNVTTGSTLKVTLADGAYYTFTPNDNGKGAKQLYNADGSTNGDAVEFEVR